MLDVLSPLGMIRMIVKVEATNQPGWMMRQQTQDVADPGYLKCGTCAP